jgi:hypothetical protein
MLSSASDSSAEAITQPIVPAVFHIANHFYVLVWTVNMVQVMAWIILFGALKR